MPPAKYMVGKKPCQRLHIVDIDTTLYNTYTTCTLNNEMQFGIKHGLCGCYSFPISFFGSLKPQVKLVTKQCRRMHIYMGQALVKHSQPPQLPAAPQLFAEFPSKIWKMHTENIRANFVCHHISDTKNWAMP